MKIKSTFSAPILVTAVILLFTISRFLDIEALSYRENICLAIIVLQMLILVVPCVLYAKLKGEGFTKRLYLAPFGVEKLLITLLASITLILGDILIKLGLYNLGIIDGDYSVYYYYLNGADPGVLYALVTFVLVPAVCEEVLFRSVLMTEYESCGAAGAAVASALLYAMFGMNFGYFPIYFFAGLIFALVLYITRSVFASMICHLIYGVFGLVAGETVRTVITKPQSTGFLIFAVSSLFLLCLTALFSECERIYYGYALAKKSARPNKKFQKTDGKVLLTALLAPPFLVAVLVFIVSAIQTSGY